MNTPIAYLFDVVVTPWKLVGYLGVFLFAGRWVVQIAATRKHGKPVFPGAFWTMSVLGSALLLRVLHLGKERLSGRALEPVPDDSRPLQLCDASQICIGSRAESCVTPGQTPRRRSNSSLCPLSFRSAMKPTTSNALALEICAALADRGAFEIIFVDDASTDSTAKNIRAIRRGRASQIRLLRHSVRCGQSIAVQYGSARCARRMDRHAGRRRTERSRRHSSAVEGSSSKAQTAI